jgi:hypothetical protein
MHPMLRLSIYAIQASKFSRGCPRLPFWQGPMRSQQPSSVSSSPTELAPVAPTGADDDDEQAERQVDGDDLADAVEAGAGARPVRYSPCASSFAPCAVSSANKNPDDMSS